MSNLRVIGLIVGIFGLFLTFRIYRGPKWRRLNFILFGIFSLFLIGISLNPNLINIIAQMFALKQEQRGRLLALLIGSSIALWFLFLYLKTKLDESRYQFDLLIRSLGHDEAKHILEREIADKDIVVIIPAYNEVDNLKELLKKIPHKIGDNKIGVLVVDDGSTDNTTEMVKQEGCMLVRNRINRGQGGASRLGYDVLLNHNIRIGVTMDSDNQHAPKDIEKLVQYILDGKYDLVIGSRILGEQQRGSFLRNVGISFFSKVINFSTGLKLTDCSSGFKAFNVDKIRKLNLREEQFQAAEVIIEAAKKGLRIKEVPIKIEKRKYGKSKKGKDLNYGLFFAKTILKAWWRK